VKRFQNRSDVLKFWSLDNSSSKIIKGKRKGGEGKKKGRK